MYSNGAKPAKSFKFVTDHHGKVFRASHRVRWRTYTRPSLAQFPRQ
jgi:hypothetical protein